MAITTLDGAIAGFQAPRPIIKTGITMAAVGAMRGYTPWYAAGNPGASVANAVGINGQAVDPSLGTSVQGRIPRTNPATGTPHLPDTKSSPQAKARGVGLYLVEDLLVDADLFRRLRARGLARGRDGVADLETARSGVWHRQPGGG